MKKNLLFTLCFTIFLSLVCSGCGMAHLLSPDNPVATNGPVSIGTMLTAENPEGFTLLNNNDALAGDGLFYTTWVTGTPTPYENSEGETVDLYEAQIYFLSNECSSPEKADENCQAWLSTAKETYQITSEEVITCNNQAYTLISYTPSSTDSPYDRGVSAFATANSTAVCVEFTCTSDYTNDIKSILTDFLNNCTYNQE